MLKYVYFLKDKICFNI